MVEPAQVEAKDIPSLTPAPAVEMVLTLAHRLSAVDEIMVMSKVERSCLSKPEPAIYPAFFCVADGVVVSLGGGSLGFHLTPAAP